MELSAQNINILFTTFDMVFQKAFAVPEVYYTKVATVVRSASAAQLYPWMGRTTKFSLWKDERTLQNLEAHAYSITNFDYEDTVEISRNAIEDDTHGIYTPVIEQLGYDTKAHPDVLIANLITNAVQNIDTPSAANAVVAYDGLTFFSAAGHPAGLMNNGTATTYPNIDTSGSGPFWYLLDCSRAMRPFVFQVRQPYKVVRMNAVNDEELFMRKQLRYGVDGRVGTGVGFWQFAYASNKDLTNPANYAAVRAAMRNFKTDAGLPFGVLGNGNKDVILMVPPALEEPGRMLMNSDFMVGMGASNSVSTSNTWKGSANLVVNPYLS